MIKSRALTTIKGIPIYVTLLVNNESNKIQNRQWITSKLDTTTPIQQHFKSDEMNTYYKDVNDN